MVTVAMLIKPLKIICMVLYITSISIMDFIQKATLPCTMETPDDPDVQLIHVRKWPLSVSAQWNTIAALGSEVVRIAGIA